MTTGIKLSENQQNPKHKIFVVGVGRSGTSLLQAMLDTHTQVAFLPETGFFRQYVVPRQLSRVLKQSGIAGVKDCLARNSRIKRLDADLVEAIEKKGLLMDVPDSNDADIQLYEYLHAELQSALTGDKDPKLVEYIDIVKALWPSAKIIHIYRDPRDVLSSKKKAQWSQNKPLLGQIVANVAQFKLAINAEKRFSNSDVHTVRYESLINKPEAVLTGICQWLHIPFEVSMLAHQQSAKKLVFNDEIQWKSEVLGPVITTNSGKWQTELSSFEAALAATCCKSAMDRGRYETQTQNAKSVRLRVAILSPMVSLVASVYCHYRHLSNLWLVRKLGLRQVGK